MQKFVCSISRKDLQDLSDLAMQVYRNPDELPFTYFRPIRDRLYSWGFDAIKDAQAVMYLGRGDYESYQIARNDLEDSGWLFQIALYQLYYTFIFYILSEKIDENFVIKSTLMHNLI